jgi:hypothetical protein
MAVEAAADEALRLGYVARTTVAAQLEGPAEDVGRELAHQAMAMSRTAGPNCFISGGEPTVVLADPAVRVATSSSPSPPEKFYCASAPRSVLSSPAAPMAKTAPPTLLAPGLISMP